ncbi:hypothetical protein N181_21185 [Sinorhizobium fredii USDA 205]|uniref:Uncharacterized protein n=2 Tax=Rhizobium fredii TaxID=380 RepID=A0A844AKU3_RHIFR|nr:hypothetical protein [Sinorhizobium fredii]AWM27308.1 hypothetical protein AOX55_00004086 [Sinorhizobium fredii CCBAU 25509]KSV86456.1 hypothetical protein N181_21185 [Sinorhizobium fredii USDA 205]MCG5475274.1 hypothetical protein [Sinorhizobium fredii]MQW94745.1 hypothetical protein [Sinorhizobium fredii]MQX11996.1 hypothetical protein [Sinorhizobium fredii]
MFDRGLNWERRADGTILYRRTPSEPPFIIDERALGQILRFKFMIPLMSFLTLLPAVSLGPVARHGHVSFAVPVGAFLLGAAFFYAYFRSVERRIKRILAEARPSVQAPEPYKTPRDARGWKTLDDGSVQYWSRTMPRPVVMTPQQFAAIGNENSKVLACALLSAIILVLTDGYRWVGDINNGTAIAILMAVLLFNALYIARFRERRHATLKALPPAPSNAKVQPPLAVMQALLVAASVLREKVAGASVLMLLILGFASLFGMFSTGSTLIQLNEGVAFYFGKRNSFPMGPALPVGAFLVSVLLAKWTASALVARVGRKRD